MYAGPFIFYCNLQHWEVAAHPNIGLYVWTSCAGTHQVPPLLCGYPTTAISWPRLPCHGNMAQLCNLPCHHSMAKLCNYPATAVWPGCAMIPPALWPSCARTPPPLYGPAVELLHYRCLAQPCNCLTIVVWPTLPRHQSRSHCLAQLCNHC